MRCYQSPLQQESGVPRQWWWIEILCEQEVVQLLL